MALTAEAYLTQLQALLPQGAAWPRAQDATLTKLLRAWADELARVDLRADDLVNEIDPRTTLELLPDWERVAGLPDPCNEIPETLAERRAALVAKLTSRGGQSRQFFIDLAAALGFDITIDELRPFTCESPCEDPLYEGDETRFVWRVNGPEVTIKEMTCVDPCTTPLRKWGNELLECPIRRRKPAHTTVLFAFPPKWSPLEFEDDLYLWYHARDPSGYTLNGSAVATLLDRSGNDRDAVANDTTITPATIVPAGIEFPGASIHMAGFPNSFRVTSVPWPAEGTVVAIAKPKEVADRDVFGSTDGFNSYSVGLKFRANGQFWLDVIPDSTANRTLIAPATPTYVVDDIVTTIGRWSAFSGVVFERSVNDGEYDLDTGAYKNPHDSTDIAIAGIDHQGNGALDHVLSDIFIVSRDITAGEALQIKAWAAEVAGV